MLHFCSDRDARLYFISVHYMQKIDSYIRAISVINGNFWHSYESGITNIEETEQLLFYTF